MIAWSGTCEKSQQTVLTGADPHLLLIRPRANFDLVARARRVDGGLD